MERGGKEERERPVSDSRTGKARGPERRRTATAEGKGGVAGAEFAIALRAQSLLWKWLWPLFCWPAPG